MYSIFENAVIIDIHDFAIYDQIITFLLPSNRILSAIALGTKKITSKNARRIGYLNQVEAEIFLARSGNKLSKLKSVHLNYEFEFKYLKLDTFRIFIKYLSKQKEVKQDFYSFLIKQMELIKQHNLNDQISTLKLLTLIYWDLGLSFNFNKCVICGTNKVCTLSLNNTGMVCCMCNDKELVYPKWFLKNFYYLINNQNKITFKSQEEQEFFCFHGIKILKKLIDSLAGVNLY